MNDNTNKSFYLKTGLGIGEGFPVRVNLNFGINRLNEYSYEKEKIDTLLTSSELRPDIMMDLSTIKVENPLYQRVIHKYELPIGIVPVYICFNSKKGIDKIRLLEELHEFAENNVSFFTLHLTANKRLQELAQTRKIPLTSRGGAVLLSDQKINNRENILLENLENIISLCIKHNITISLGTSFRPSSIIDACDEVHLAETEEQLKLCEYLKSKGVKVMVENVGHISLDKLAKHCKKLQEFEAPIMPLGPLPTDSGFEQDHIASAIGASMMGFYNCAHIINCITRKEHVSSEIFLDDMKEGIKAAKLTGHIIDLSFNREKAISVDRKIYTQRANMKNCLLSGVDCERCAEQCPLNLVL